MGNSILYYYIWALMQQNMSWGFPDKGRLKTVSSATESSYKIEILLVHVTSLDMILSKK